MTTGTEGWAPDGWAVHQVLPSLHVADASGAHTLHARDALRDAGFASEIFVEHVDPPLAAQARPFDDLDRFVVPGRSAVLYQLAVGSVLVDHLLRRREPLLVNHHNLTPASFFWPWAPDWLYAVEAGREQLYRLAPRVTHAIAVSRFNEQDLQGAGYRSTSVVPPFVDVGAFARGGVRAGHPPTRPPGAPGGGGGARWLFVGKLLPHKSAHDLVRALAAYRQMFDPAATLVVVGGHPVASYARAVADYAAALGLETAVELAGSVTHDELAALYDAADVFVCLSEHEGFCFPLLEAMHHGVPVVAFDAGAVADTLGPAGLVLRAKDPGHVAAAVHRVVHDAALRAGLADAGRDRLAHYDLARTARRFVAEVTGALERSGALRRPGARRAAPARTGAP